MLAALLAILASSSAMAVAGDWLSVGGDPEGSGWQRHGKTLAVVNVNNLKLLWKRRLDDPPAKPELLSAPVIVGPTITHRGVRELVFIADGHDNVYAFDADLGTPFWKRHFDVKPGSPCFGGMPATTPVIEPDPDEDLSGDPVTDDEGDDEAGPMRPLYAVASDGRLHTIRVSDGADMNPPIDFLPPNEGYSSLNFWSGTVYAATWGGCNGAPSGFWAIDVKRPGTKPAFYSAKEGRGIVVGPSGRVYGAAADGTVALQPGSLKMKQFSEIAGVAFTAVKYQGRELIATETPDGELLLLDAANLSLVEMYRTARTRFTGLATCQDPKGVRWLYAATEGDLRAFKFAGPPSSPKLELAWASGTQRAGSPVVTNGVVLMLTGDILAPFYSALKALDAATGKELYSSEHTVGVPVYVPYLAVANGHICFSDSRNTLYCFGIPMER